MNIVELLKKDHREILSLFAEIEGTGPTSYKKRGALLGEIKERLALHMKFEEDFFYPILHEEKKLRTDVYEGYMEHELGVRTMTELEAMDLDDVKWMAKLHVLKDLIQHHIDEEEKNLLPAAKKTIDKDELKELGEQFEELQHREGYAEQKQKA